ncbi:type II secretion system protein [Deinococcus cellulosilyticus]|uniref:type II secretion system protein n=1 Tax=Deinococcus cellulosilyticus TaxID=401558 RepID=UPI001649C7CC|nr:type II secretion system protein [Deinococcus cellulosilyticus]
MTSNKRSQQGFTVVEILMALLIVGLILGTTVVQVSNLFKTNRQNTSVLSVNTLAANELENIKESWSQLSSWELGVYTPSNTQVAFSCANWTNFASAPTSFSSACVGASYLKRVKLVVTGTNNKTITVFLDIAKPT